MKKSLSAANLKNTIPFHVYNFIKKESPGDHDIIRGNGNLPSYIPVSPTAMPLHQQPFESRGNRIIKRIIDILFATVVIICILSWLIPIIAILIKLDSKGPVFFMQKRNKKDGKIFTCFKFRSMVINEEADLKPALENDSRITRIGKFLRRTYLDEFPQFFNVLWGDMSVIGPRPHMVSENLIYDEVVTDYSYRYKVRPGITGLAQALGYVGSFGDIQEIKERVNMDIYYVRHWSLKLDFIILYQTTRKILG